MGKSSGTAIAVIALFISIGFGGYFIYDKFFAAATTPSIPASNQYYSQASNLYMLSGEAWSTGNSLSIEFNISEGESVYFSYEGLVTFDDSSIPNTYVEFRFKVDGIIWYFPQRYVRRYNADDPGGLRFSVSMQHYNSTMPTGTHTVTVVCRGDHTVDSLGYRSLFVQTFK